MKKYSVVVILAFVWAAYYYSLGISNKLISPFATGVFIRFFTFVILTVVMGVLGRLALLRVERRFLPRLAAIGCLGFLLDITAFLGSRYGNAATGTILLKTDVIMIGLISAVVYKERLSKKEWGLVAVMLVGVMLVTGVNPAHLTLNPSDILFLLSALFVSINAFVIKSVQRDGVHNNVIAYYNNLVTLFFFTVAALITGSGKDLLAAPGNSGLMLALTVGALGQFFIYIFYYRSLQTLPVWNVKIILLLIPIITLLYDLFFTGAVPGATQLAGTAIVLASAMLVIRVQSQKTNGSVSK